MPTGYTAKLYAGEQSFEDYAWGVARGFGALVTMRDAPADAPIPEEFTPRVEYHDEKIAQAEARLTELHGMSLEDAARESEAEYRAQMKRAMEDRLKRSALRDRYEAVLEQARAWEPPTPEHVEFKKTMVEQLQQAIDFDCDREDLPVGEAPNPSEWLQAEIARTHETIAYHRRNRHEEILRSKQRTAWVKALRDSLGAVHA